MIIKAIYPGTFDPLTNGHLHIIMRAKKIFNYIILAIAHSPSKTLLFNFQERIKLATQATAHLSNVKVLGFKNLLVNFAYQQKTNIIIRGLRTLSDFENEIQLSKMYHHLLPKLEVVFFIAIEPWSYVSSALIKEIALHNGSIENFLPINIAKAMKKRIHLYHKDIIKY